MPRFFTSSAEKTARRRRNIDRLIKKQVVPLSPAQQQAKDGDLLVRILESRKPKT